jgi:hypothetical protein
MECCQAEVYRATQNLWTQVSSWHLDIDPYAPHTEWEWEKIAQLEFPNANGQAVWWSDMVVALVIKAALRNLPVDTAISAQALAAAQILRTTAGAGTLDLMLLNANHSADTSGHSAESALGTSAM